MLQPQTLHYSTNINNIDKLLQGLVGIFEMVFPGRIRAYYLVGSYADASHVPLSDIDLRVVFRGDFAEQEEARFLELRHDCRSISPIAIDCPALSEARLQSDPDWVHETISIKESGRFLYGDDLRAGLALPDFDTYLQNVTLAPLSFFGRMHGQEVLDFPLTYPDPTGEFFGYCAMQPEEEDRNSGTKMLVHLAGFAATCLVGLHARQMVVKKSDWLPAYQQYVADEWTPFLGELYHLCKEEWAYRVPEEAAQRIQLRNLCQQTLAFENYYLAEYQAYLQNESEKGDESTKAVARERLQRINLLNPSTL